MVCVEEKSVNKTCDFESGRSTARKIVHKRETSLARYDYEFRCMGKSLSTSFEKTCKSQTSTSVAVFETPVEKKQASHHVREAP